MTDIETLIYQFSGIQDPDSDIQLTESELENLITEYTNMVQDWVNTYTKIEYTDTNIYSTYPEGLKEIIMEMVSNILRNHVLRKDTPIIDSENYKTHQIVETVLSEDIEKRLKPYIKKPRPQIRVIGRNSLYTTTEEDVVD